MITKKTILLILTFIMSPLLLAQPYASKRQRRVVSKQRETKEQCAALLGKFLILFPTITHSMAALELKQNEKTLEKKKDLFEKEFPRIRIAMADIQLIAVQAIEDHLNGDKTIWDKSSDLLETWLKDLQDLEKRLEQFNKELIQFYNCKLNSLATASICKSLEEMLLQLKKSD